MKTQVRNVDTRRALAKTSSSNVEGEMAYLDNAADTFGIGVTAWTVESLSVKTVHIQGYSEDDTSSNVPIGNAVTALDLPDGETLILHANEGTVLGDKDYTLASEKQMEANVSISKLMVILFLWLSKKQCKHFILTSQLRT